LKHGGFGFICEGTTGVGQGDEIVAAVLFAAFGVDVAAGEQVIEDVGHGGAAGAGVSGEGGGKNRFGIEGEKHDEGGELEFGEGEFLEA
jgi:hypothetical protein